MKINVSLGLEYRNAAAQAHMAFPHLENGNVPDDLDIPWRALLMASQPRDVIWLAAYFSASIIKEMWFV
jgi:hypothetical protein